MQRSLLNRIPKKGLWAIFTFTIFQSYLFFLLPVLIIDDYDFSGFNFFGAFFPFLYVPYLWIEIILPILNPNQVYGIGTLIIILFFTLIYLAPPLLLTYCCLVIWRWRPTFLLAWLMAFIGSVYGYNLAPPSVSTIEGDPFIFPSYPFIWMNVFYLILFISNFLIKNYFPESRLAKGIVHALSLLDIKKNAPIRNPCSVSYANHGENFDPYLTNACQNKSRFLVKKGVWIIYTFTIFQSYLFFLLPALIHDGYDFGSTDFIFEAFLPFISLPWHAFNILLTILSTIRDYGVIELISLTITIFCFVIIIVLVYASIAFWHVKRDILSAWLMAFLGSVYGFIILGYSLDIGGRINPAIYPVLIWPNLFYLCLGILNSVRKRYWPGCKFAARVRKILLWPCMKVN